MAVYTVRLECGTIKTVVSKKSINTGDVISIDWESENTKLSGIVCEIISIEKKGKSENKKTDIEKS